MNYQSLGNGSTLHPSLYIRGYWSRGKQKTNTRTHGYLIEALELKSKSLATHLCLLPGFFIPIACFSQNLNGMVFKQKTSAWWFKSLVFFSLICSPLSADSLSYLSSLTLLIRGLGTVTWHVIYIHWKPRVTWYQPFLPILQIRTTNQDKALVLSLYY